MATPVQTRSDAVLALTALAVVSAVSGALCAKLALAPGKAQQGLARMQGLAGDTTGLASQPARGRNVDSGFGVWFGPRTLKHGA